MLNSKNRLPRKDFSLILRAKNFFNSPHFSIRASLDTHSPKVAVSVSKKVSKSAVVRNTIRRRAYSAIRPLLNEMSGAYLFQAKKGAEDLRGEKLSRELVSLLKQVKRR